MTARYRRIRAEADLSAMRRRPGAHRLRQNSGFCGVFCRRLRTHGGNSLARGFPRRGARDLASGRNAGGLLMPPRLRVVRQPVKRHSIEAIGYHPRPKCTGQRHAPPLVWLSHIAIIIARPRAREGLARMTRHPPPGRRHCAGLRICVTCAGLMPTPYKCWRVSAQPSVSLLVGAGASSSVGTLFST